MEFNKTKTTEIQYFGDVYYYLNLLNARHIYFNHALLHSKELQVNRTRIMAANKVLILSVPLEGGRSVKVNIKDLKIASRSSWQRIHWRSIHDGYRKAPWFEEYAPELEKLFGQSYIYLWDWNVKIISWVLQALRWNAVIMSETEFPNISDRRQMGGEFQEAKGIDYPAYQQVFSHRLGFQANLSILDLIMNEGPAATLYLQKLSAYYGPNPGNVPI